MGVGATWTLARVAASLGQVSAGTVPVVTPALDVADGGMLWAVPSLLSVGLLAPALEIFAPVPGYYALASLLLVLAFLALARVPSLEQVRYLSPGDWGRLVGLDRIPDVKTLRQKLTTLCAEKSTVAEWGRQLAQQWMQTGDDHAGFFYLDGHLREYSGAHTRLPRHFAARRKLCVRGVMEYWVNAYGGAPLFVVSKELDPGLVAMLRDEIVPRLLQEYQPPATGAGPKFTMIFDRGGFSPSLFAALSQQGIAVLTYQKYVTAPWPTEEFTQQSVTLVSGEVVEMQLAERPLCCPPLQEAREIRRLTKSGHQTAIICTHATLPLTTAAPYMFARWCQENFFKYAVKEFNIDHLLTYDLEELPDTTRVVNPQRKALESAISRVTQQRQRPQAKLGTLSLRETALSDKAVEKYQHQQGEWLQDIEEQTQVLQLWKEARATTPRHISLGELPVSQRYQGMTTGKKLFVDTIKMIAYRAETTMANILRAHLARPEDVRSLLQALFTSPADLLPDEDAHTVTIRLHHPSARYQAEALQRLAAELNETATLYPGTELRMIFQVGTKNGPA